MYQQPPHSARLVVPVLETTDVVVISLNSLPAEAEELLEILAAEAAPLSTWFDFAKAYLAQGREDAFKAICEEGVKDEVTEEVIRFFGARPVYDQTQFHCGLAALHMARGREEADRARKAECFALAAKSIQAAKLMNPDEQLVSIAQGMLHMSKNELQQARQEFTKACNQQNNGRTNVIGLLALASLLFDQKHYQDALLLYRRALAQNPACPAEVRLGIAACQFHMGDQASAAAAFERVLALDPHNADALMGLAVIKFRSQNAQQGMADGLRLLVRAFELDPGNVGALVLLSHYSLLRGDYGKVLVLARAALDATQVESVQAQCHCLLARAFHAQGQFQQASQQYALASRLNASLALPHLGLAQLYVRQGAAVNASTELELALKNSPGLFDALKVLGQVIGEDQPKVSKALVHMKAAVGKAEEDPDVWELMGDMCTTAGDHAGSLAAFKRALDIHRTRRQVSEQARAAFIAAQQERHPPTTTGGGGGLFGDEEEEEDAAPPPPLHDVPAMLLNNTAVLHYRAGDLTAAAQLLGEAQQAAVAGAAGLAPQHVAALRYNVARLQEASGLLKQAEEGYKAILAEDASSVDCMLRLSCVAHSRGASQEALDWAKQAADLEGPGQCDALAIMSQLAMERRDYPTADQCIKKLMSKSKEAAAASKAGPAAAAMSSDAYAQLAYGNLLLNSAPSDRRKDVDARRAENNMYKGLECFRAVLKNEPHNAFAANGIGAVLAELGRLQDAQEVFGEVQAAVASSGGFLQIPDVYINLANVALAKQEYVTAQRLYKIAMDKLGDTKKSQVLLYLARAYYDSNDLPAAKACLLRAIHIAPTDYKLRFNAALTMQEYALRTFKKQRAPNDPSCLAEYERAKADLESAQRYFEHLDQLGVHRTKLESHRVTAHIGFCKDLIKKSSFYIDKARGEAAQQAAKREEVEQMRALDAERKALELRRKELAARATQEAKEAEARRAHERQERLKQEWRLQRAEIEGAEEGGEGGGKGKKSKGKKDKGGSAKGGARAMAADDEEPSGGAEDEGPAGAQGGDEAGTGAADDDLFGSGAGEDDLADKDMAGLEDEDVADGEGRAGGGRKRGRAAALDEEDEEEGGRAAAAAPQGSGDAFLQDLDDPAAGGVESGAGAGGGDEEAEGEDGPAQKRRRGAALVESEGEGGRLDDEQSVMRGSCTRPCRTADQLFVHADPVLTLTLFHKENLYVWTL